MLPMTENFSRSSRLGYLIIRDKEVEKWRGRETDWTIRVDTEITKDDDKRMEEGKTVKLVLESPRNVWE